MKQSSFLAQSQIQRNEKMLGNQSSRKQLSASTFLDLHDEQNKISNSRRLQRKETEFSHHNEELKRARSLKFFQEIKFKPTAEMGDKHQTLQLNENLVRLKIEEMVFKFKTKLGTLLKQINISIADLNKFSSLLKIDDMLNFISERIKEKLVSTQISQSNSQKIWSKEKDLLSQYEAQIETLKKKNQQKDVSEKMLKNKVKDNHNELRELYDRINQKEKDLSLKVTELYQCKIMSKELQKMNQNLKEKYSFIQKERNDLKNMLNNQNKSVNTNNKIIEQQNKELRESLQQFKDELVRSSQKQMRILELNKQLTEEVARWRERFQEQRQKQREKSSQSQNQQAEMIPATPNDMKKSTMSMNNYFQRIRNSNNPKSQSITALQIQNTKLISKVKDLEKENKQLSRDILNYSTIKERYQQTLAVIGQTSIDISPDTASSGKIQSLKESSKDLFKMQLQTQYKKKIQSVIKQWKDKLYEIVYKYQDQFQSMKQAADLLASEKEQLQRKVFQLANEKYIVENKLIQKEKQLYQVNKSRSNSSITQLQQEMKEQPKSQEMLISSANITSLKEDANLTKNRMVQDRQLPSEPLLISTEQLEQQSNEK